MRKKILVIAPILPQKNDINAISASLSFLENDYHIKIIDPLSFILDANDRYYYQHWKNYLESIIDDYDCYFGFSFGGIILQQCFSLFEQFDKTLVLFSTPSFASDLLTKKLSKLITLCKKNNVKSALSLLSLEVYYPNKPPENYDDSILIKEVCSRLTSGFQHVIDTNSKSILEQTAVPYLHLIGEQSSLVTKKDIISSNTAQLVMVPSAGMRVLQDNPNFCQKIILERLNRETN
jgi:pimeloyl-ACP methyl ester carboxylesterase